MSDEPSPIHAAISRLANEVDCRIEHGAQSGGHLEYVRLELRKILELDDERERVLAAGVRAAGGGTR